jgi:Leucine-rich repeat (LRR) protein
MKRNNSARGKIKEMVFNVPRYGWLPVLVVGWVLLLATTTNILPTHAEGLNCSLSNAALQSLEDIYVSCDGLDWNWNFSLPNYTMWQFPTAVDIPCTYDWQGIKCIALNVVDNISRCSITSLNLADYDLKGSLPASIRNLSDLSLLKLSSNSLSSSLPISLFNLTNLTKFEADSNALTGTIPTEVGSLSNLQLLNLGTNNMYGPIPEGLSNLDAMWFLSLDGLQITGTLPTFLMNMTVLEVLSIANTNLTGIIPSELGSLQNLEFLDLSGTSIIGTIPSELGQLERLLYLNLSSTSLGGTLPASLAGLTSILSIYIDDTMIHGHLPAELGTGWNNTLQFLSLSSNLLSGPIPPEIALMPNLTIFNLYRNQFTGPLPFLPGMSSSLEYFDVSTNLLTGTMISNWSTFKSLQYFYIDTNQVDGSIPDISLAGPYPSASISLLQFDVSTNRVGGSIPNGIWTHTDLLNLEINENFITGALSSQLTNLGSLFSIDVSTNLLTGSLDGVFTDRCLKNLTSVNLGNNSFTGHVPVIDAPNLTMLALTSNCFSGTVPESYCSLTELSYMLLDTLSSDSSCAAEIPAILKPVIRGTFPKNEMIGSIPSCLLLMPNLMTLQLSGNGFSGSIPSLLSPSINSLDLSFNALTGHIPLSIQRSGQFGYLSLKNNKLGGTLVSDFSVSRPVSDTAAARGSLAASDTTATTNLYLSVNRISGTIPSTFHTLPVIEVLSGNIFSCNSLFGQQESLPVNEEDRNHYVCGSNQLDFVLYLWLSCFGILFGILSVWYILIQIYNDEDAPSNSDVTVEGGQSTLRGSLVEMRASQSQSENHSALVDSILSLPSIGRQQRAGQQQLGSGQSQSQEHYHSQRHSVSDSSRSVFVSIKIRASAAAHNVFTESHDWLSIDLSQYNLTDTEQFMDALAKISKGAAVSALAYCLIMIGYMVLKLSFADGYTTTTVQYLWVTTATFLHGYLPACCLLVIVCVSCLVAVLRLRYQDLVSKQANDSIKRENWRVTARYSLNFNGASVLTQAADFVLLPTLAQVMNLAVVVSANAVYIKVLQIVPPTTFLLIQVLMSVFKTAWVYLYIPVAMSHLRHLPIKSYMRQLTSMLVVNFIVGPAIALCCASSICFYNIFVSESAISTSFGNIITVCQASLTFHFSAANHVTSTSVTECYKFEPPVLTASSKPPFMYSYQCGSAFLVDYIPVLLYSYLFTAVVVPIIRLVMVHSSSEYMKRMFGHALFQRFIVNSILDTEGLITQGCQAGQEASVDSDVPGHPGGLFTQAVDNPITAASISGCTVSPYRAQISQPSLTRQSSALTVSSEAGSNTSSLYKQPLFDGTFVVAKRLLDIAVLMTFGLACPLLAITIALSIFMQSLTWRLMIGKYLSKAGKDNISAFSRLERSFKDGLLRGAVGGLGIVILTVAAFWAFLFFDMIADQNTDADGMIFTLTTFLMLPFVSYVVHKFNMWTYARQVTKNSEAATRELSAGRDTVAGGRLSVGSIHNQSSRIDIYLADSPAILSVPSTESNSVFAL